MPLHRLRTFLSRGRKALVHPTTGEAISHVPLLDMLAHNWHLGLTSFGGPTVHFQIFRERFVQQYHWLDDSAYDELFAVCQALSGPGSTKVLYGINVLRYGVWTALAAVLVWSLPMAIAGWGLALGVGKIGDRLPGPAYALLSGLNSATVGVVALAAVQLARKAVTDTVTRVVVFVGGAAGLLYSALWYLPVLMVMGAVTTLVWDLRVVQRVGRRVVGSRRDRERSRTSEDVEMHDVSHTPAEPASSVQSRSGGGAKAAPEVIHTAPPAAEARTRLLRSWKSGVAIIAAFLATFTVVMVLRGAYSGATRAFDLFSNLYLAGTIIFGGGPVVIPLLREYTVDPGWVAPRDFLLGLAITQAFPGPNFNFAVYLGTLAVRHSRTPPTAGAVIAFLAIFTPGIWLTTGLMGVWSSVRRVQAVKSALRGIHAAAVGLVFTAVYRLWEIGYLDADVREGGSLSRDPWWVVIVATSFVGGLHFRLSPPLAIVLGAVMGLVWYAVVRV